MDRHDWCLKVQKYITKANHEANEVRKPEGIQSKNCLNKVGVLSNCRYVRALITRVQIKG